MVLHYEDSCFHQQSYKYRILDNKTLGNDDFFPFFSFFFFAFPCIRCYARNILMLFHNSHIKPIE